MKKSKLFRMVWLMVGTLLISGISSADVMIAGWDTWHATNPNQVASLVAVSLMATMTPSTDPLLGDASGNWTATVTGSKDGTFGAFAGADTVSGSSMLARGAGVYLDFTLTNTGVTSYELNTFHLDGWIRFSAPNVPSVSVLAGGGITAGALSSSVTWTALGATPPADADYTDDDISLLGLADHTLAAGESATFRITQTGGGGVYYDNVALTGVIPEPATMGLVASAAIALLAIRRIKM